MKSHLIHLLALGLLVSSASAQDKPDLTNPKQRVSYAIGMDIVTNLKQQGLDLDPKALAAGVADTVAGKAALTAEEQKEAMTRFNEEMMAKRQEQMAKQQSQMAKLAEEDKANGEKYLKAGEAFLAENKKKEGVKVKQVTLPDGSKAELQYKILKSGVGTGASPKKTSEVKVHYHGTLIDGTVFDSSVDRGEPVSFPLDQVIAGWTEGVQLMKVGDKWQFFIPSILAYKESRRSEKIGPNFALIFEVELLGIEKE